MKKCISLLLVFVLAIMTSVIGVTAAGEEIWNVFHMGNWYYTKSGNSGAVIVNYNGSDSVLTVPAVVNDRNVVRIDDRIFGESLRGTIKEVTIPEGISELDASFAGCEALESVVLPESLKKMDGTFNGCLSLRSVVIPDSVGVISSRCFSGCRSLTHVTIGKGVTKIESYAFYNCINLREIYIPPEVTEISDAYALGYYTKLLPSGDAERLKTDLTIKGAGGSAAEDYAVKNDIPFVEADEDTILYPDAPFIDPLPESYLRLNDDEPIAVKEKQLLRIMLFAIAPRPVGELWGFASTQDKQDLVDVKACLASEEEGALMTGEVTPSGNAGERIFDLHAATDDANLFEDYAFENAAGQTVYVQPVIEITILPHRGMNTVESKIQYAHDIDGRYLRDSDIEFTDSAFSYKLMVVPDDADTPIMPLDPVDPEPTAPLRGDADRDGKVTVLDATRIQRYLAYMIGENGLDTTAADADLDGKVTILDATRIQRVLASLCDMDGKTPQDEQEEPPVTPPVDPDHLPAPRIMKVESSNSGVVITWDAVEGAEGFRVFMKSGDAWKRLGDTGALSYTHTDAPYDVEVTYTVRCISADGSKYTSDYDKEGYRNIRFKAPVLKSAKLMDGLIGVSWDKVAGVEAYRVYIKGGQYGSWTAVYDAGTNYIDVDAELLELRSNTKYTFTVRCIDGLLGSRCVSGHDSAGVSVKYYETPFIYAIVNTEEGIELYWTEVEGVAKYRVFEWIDDGWKKLTDTEDTAILVSGLYHGDWYRFTVRGLDSSGNFLTPYDSYGRLMQWYRNPTNISTDYQADDLALAAEDYAQALGFNVDHDAEVDPNRTGGVLLDSTAFYYGNRYSRSSIEGHSASVIDRYAAILRRADENPEDYHFSVVTSGGYNDSVWFYAVIAPVKKV